MVHLFYLCFSFGIVYVYILRGNQYVTDRPIDKTIETLHSFDKTKPLFLYISRCSVKAAAIHYQKGTYMLL